MKRIIGIWLIGVTLSSAQGLEFAEILKNVDAPADAVIVTAEFPFTNKSDKSVLIAKTDSGCSCLKVEVFGGKLKYAPGESGVVKATFEMGNFSGTVDKSVALWIDSDAPDRPSKQLTVRVNIPVLVGIEPKTVKWDVGAKPEPQTIQVRMAEGKPIHVLGVKSSSESFSCEVKPIEVGKKYDIIVTPKDLNSPGMSVIRIQTDCEISKHRTQQAFAVARIPIPNQAPPKP